MNRGKTAGLTLLELSAIFGILVILAAVLVPVIAQARQIGNRSADIASLKAINTAQSLYSQDYDEAVPSEIRSVDSDRAAIHVNRSNRFYQPEISTTLGACVATAPANFVSTGGGCKDSTTGLIWSATGHEVEGAAFLYSGATHFCSNLNEQGVTGWRMATSSELSKFAADGAYYAVLDNYPVEKWSSTQAKGNSYFAVTLQTGVAAARNTRTYALDAICVK